MDDSQSTLIIKLIELSWTAGLIAVSRTVIDVVVLKYIQNYRKIFKALRLTSLIYVLRLQTDSYQNSDLNQLQNKW